MSSRQPNFHFIPPSEQQTPSILSSSLPAPGVPYPTCQGDYNDFLYHTPPSSAQSYFHYNGTLDVAEASRQHFGTAAILNTPSVYHPDSGFVASSHTPAGNLMRMQDIFSAEFNMSSENLLTKHGHTIGHDVFVDVSRPTSEQPMDYQEKLADLGLPEGSSFSDDVGYPANFYEIMPNTLPATSVWYGLAMVSPPQLGLSTPSSLTDITDNESGCLTPETPCIIPNALAGQTSTDVAHPTPTEAARSPSNKYHCHGCQEDFINRHVFNRHQTSDKHLKSTGQVLGSNRIYRCEFCEYQANRVDALNRHRKQVHLKQ